uniref:Uncharacterized protein n=2 Tax=unclassified Caudoviricetes TaxID=2788787 RepID=A0A8S5PIQ4_9CAUD|nr:MAG TPA: hypothetical protein [Siphoviridae sp. ctJcm18]DAE06600.1 MAG TPA: hypothetical protein [Siphoviridae sp. ctUGQ45]
MPLQTVVTFPFISQNYTSYKYPPYVKNFVSIPLILIRQTFVFSSFFSFLEVLSSSTNSKSFSIKGGAALLYKGCFLTVNLAFSPSLGLYS